MASGIDKYAEGETGDLAETWGDRGGEEDLVEQWGDRVGEEDLVEPLGDRGGEQESGKPCGGDLDGTDTLDLWAGTGLHFTGEIDNPDVGNLDRGKGTGFGC